MMPYPPVTVPGPAMTLDDSTPMGSSTALNFIKPRRDRTKALPAVSVNNGPTNAPPNAAPLAERINANKPHALVSSQSPSHVPGGTYGSTTCAPPVEHVPHRASHHGRKSMLLAEHIHPGTPERTRLGGSFRSIERLRLDTSNLQRARSPMLPPPVPASATRQTQPADTSGFVINHEAHYNTGAVTLTGDSDEHTPSESEQQNQQQNENEPILGEEPLMMESQADRYEEPVENPSAQGLQEALPILGSPQTMTKQTPLDEYLVAHAEESAQAEKRWKDTSVDEWKAGAQEMRDRLVKIIDFTKDHMKRKLDTYRSIQENISGHKERITKRRKLLDSKTKEVTETTTRMLTQIGCRNSL